MLNVSYWINKLGAEAENLTSIIDFTQNVEEDKKETDDSKQYKIIENKKQDIQEERESILHNPKTGDSIALWISLMVVSILGVAGTVKF